MMGTMIEGLRAWMAGAQTNYDAAEAEREASGRQLRAEHPDDALELYRATKDELGRWHYDPISAVVDADHARTLARLRGSGLYLLVDQEGNYKMAVEVPPQTVAAPLMA